MKRNLLLVIFLVPVLFSCHKDEFKIDPNNLLIGVWNQSDYQGNVIVYARQKGFADNPCYKFNIDGTLVERKNSGFCGTPPVSYADYNGSWTMLNDTLMQITSGYWGGTSTYKLEINLVTTDSLKVTYVFDSK
jgi:hypothetical protein